jgi:hypothetical protein
MFQDLSFGVERHLGGAGIATSLGPSASCFQIFTRPGPRVDPDLQHTESQLNHCDKWAYGRADKTQADIPRRYHPKTRRVKHGLVSPNYTSPRTTARRCLPYQTVHTCWPQSSLRGSSTGTHL